MDFSARQITGLRLFQDRSLQLVQENFPWKQTSWKCRQHVLQNGLDKRREKRTNIVSYFNKASYSVAALYRISPDQWRYVSVSRSVGCWGWWLGSMGWQPGWFGSQSVSPSGCGACGQLGLCTTVLIDNFESAAKFSWPSHQFLSALFTLFAQSAEAYCR